MRMINLYKKYKDTIILNSTNLEIRENQVVFIMGENGVGKTTLLKCILQLEKYQGEILLEDGEKIHQTNKKIGVVFDDMPLYSNLSGYQNISILINRRVDKTETIEIGRSILLDDKILKKKVKQYSNGQRKKLAILICMLIKPKYLFMDEIANGLDYDALLNLKKLLKDWASNSLVFLTGHYLDFYTDIVDTVLIMKNKQIYVYSEDFNNSDNREDLSIVYEKNIRNQ